MVFNGPFMMKTGPISKKKFGVEDPCERNWRVDVGPWERTMRMIYCNAELCCTSFGLNSLTKSNKSWLKAERWKWWAPLNGKSGRIFSEKWLLSPNRTPHHALQRTYITLRSWFCFGRVRPLNSCALFCHGWARGLFRHIFGLLLRRVVIACNHWMRFSRICRFKLLTSPSW
jgi:hypothetical protein